MNDFVDVESCIIWCYEACFHNILLYFLMLQMNCCGTSDYKDWFNTAFGNGTNVPDSCCLLIEEGCGQGIANVVDPADDIITEVGQNINLLL